jgi:hypothetical protein
LRLLTAGKNVVSAGVVTWWFFLCGAAALNIAVWSLAANALQGRQAAMPVDAFARCRIQLILSGGYVLGCAFRSVLPVYDIQRLGLFDTWLSSVVVGRSVATFAELCFAAQWAAMLNATARSTGSAFAGVVSLVILPLIVTAEVCSWYAVLTTYNLGHVFENSLWGVSAALGVVAIATIIPRCAAARRPAMVAWCVAGALYVAFMFRFDVPTYAARWAADQAAGKHYLTIAQGLFDVAHRRAVSYRWDDWKTEVVWMSLYFSAAVWISISLIQARIPAAALATEEAGLLRPARRSAV